MLHGLGGRHNDISYKILRRDFADKFNLIVIGVNYLGTDTYIRDLQWMQQWMNECCDNNSDFIMEAHARSGGAEVVDTSRLHYFANAAAKTEAEKSLADDFWDYGCLQAMDALAALHSVHRRLREKNAPFNPARNHIIAQSAGSQTALMCIKLAPRSFASIVDIGGIYVTADNREALRAVLTDPFGRIHEHHYMNATMAFDSGPRVTLYQRNPVGFSSGVSRSGATLDDELDIRDVSRPDHLGNWQPGRLCVFSTHGLHDELVSQAFKERAHAHYRHLGARSEFRTIGPADVDGNVIVSTYHEFAKNLQGACEQFASEHLLYAPPRELGTDIASDHTYAFPSTTGTWQMTFSPEPKLKFYPKP
ncbi:MAG: DUF2920 family protein [Planctomycetes bacterium]|nr:DUF2920 family protein [Planctomycetota bacterium]